MSTVVGVEGGKIDRNVCYRGGRGHSGRWGRYRGGRSGVGGVCDGGNNGVGARGKI